MHEGLVYDYVVCPVLESECLCLEFHFACRCSMLL